jgi:LysM repeat protein
MSRLKLINALFAVFLVFSLALQPARKAAAKAEPMPLADVSAGDLIMAMNTLRMSYGLPALIEDPIINAVAQGTAQIMADQLLSWHIGDVKGRIAAAGYGGGGTVWATENFAVGYNAGIDEIMVMWSYADHMRPATQSYYCNVGAGVAKASNGSTYYILQAAYVSGKQCGTYTSPGGPVGGGGGYGVIVPVSIAQPDANGRIVHEVKPGQSFWAIAVAYQVTIKEILRWNNLPEGTTLQVGQLLIIPNPNAPDYQTPTPVGYFTASPPGPDGKITHTVGAYQNLTMISQVYGVSIERILALNSLTIDMPLQIGQVLLIDPGNVTPTPTPRPLSPLEKLTPAADGKYYHTVGEGQNFTWIAQYYGIAVRFWRKPSFAVWSAVGIIAGFVLAIFIVNFESELTYGFKRIALQGRYLFPVIALFYALTAYTQSLVKPKFLRVFLIVLTCALFVFGGPLKFLTLADKAFAGWFVP